MSKYTDEMAMLDIVYFVEDWDTEETIECFATEEERTEWLMENGTDTIDGFFLTDGRRVAIYEC